MELKFEQRSVYGRMLYYPLNSAAKALVWLKGDKSKALVDEDVQMLKAAGFDCETNSEKRTK